MRNKTIIVKWIFLLNMIFLPLLLMAKPSILKKIELTNSKNSVEVCARAHNYTYSSASYDVSSYVKVLPKQAFTAYKEYSTVCIKGLKPGTDYTITLHNGMPLGKSSLDEDYRFQTTTLNYEPNFDFPEEGYILPTKGEISIPVETMNVTQLQVSLYRINNRNLIESVNSHGLLRSLGSYELANIEDKDGYKLWTKNLNINNINPNEVMTTAIPVGDFLKKRKPGVYILSADMLDKNGEVVYNYNSDSQWFMVSDIGLYTLKSDSGLEVLTKKLSTAKKYNRVKLELVAKNNEILETKISKNGKAFFPATLLRGKGGLEAKAIYAYGNGNDFSVLDLGKAAHDLSDRGVEGRKSPKLYDAFIYSNRGIFRPGESMDFHALIRDKVGVAKPGVSLSAKIFDAREVTVYTKQFKTDALGHLTDRLDISQSANTGKWRLALYAGSDKPIAQYRFLVEDFVPPKIKVELTNKVEQIKSDANTTISIAAKYLNGEALPNADVEINTIIHKVQYPVKKYSSYYFGDINEKFRNKTLKVQKFKTDVNGKLDIPYAVSQSYDTSFPLSAHIDIAVNELGGRPVHKILNALFENKENYIGLKPNFTNDAVDMGAYAKFSVLYLKHTKLAKARLHYEIIEEYPRWHWRSRNGHWEYYKTYSDDEVIQSGDVESNSSEPAVLTLKKLDWGNYRLELKDDKDAITSYRFTSGYEESSSKSSPDRLPVSIDKQSYRVGDRLSVSIQSKFSGPVVVYIAHDDLIESKTVEALAGKRSVVTFNVKKSWGNSAYVLATAFRAQSKKLGANRAVGVVPIKISHPEQEIQLTLKHQKKTASNTKVKVTIHAKDIAKGKTYFTLAAVDEGVLNLTAFKVPDPAAYFLGQRKLGIEIRDIYGDLIKARGAHAKFNVGSDAELAQAIRDDVTTNKRKVVALFTKELEFNKKGIAEVELEIPDYQGALRLMALAWNKQATGSAKSELVVKDAISTEYYMPLFISVGDKVETLLTVDFDETVESGAYEIRLRTEGGIVLDSSTFGASVEKGKKFKFSQKIVMSANKKVDGTVMIEILKNGRVTKNKHFEIGVRSTYPETYVRKMGMLKKASTLTADNLVDKSLWHSVEHLSLKISSKPLLPVESLEGELYYYPWRCAEQTTSRAMPWLFSKEKTAEQDEIIPGAIDRLLTYQDVYGGFGLWTRSHTDMWVSAYVMDFLTRAKKAGYAVPKKNIETGLNWIENKLERWSSYGHKQEADAYGLYVLARNGRILMSELKYRAISSSIKSAQAWGHLAAAFAYVGEKPMAKKMFEKARHALGNNYSGWYYSNYGGALRDEASLISLMIESNMGDIWENLLVNLVVETQKKEYFSTQELSTLLKVALQLGEGKAKELKLSVNNMMIPSANGLYKTKAATLAEIPMIKNLGEGKNWYDLSFKATPDASYYNGTHDNGFSITKTIYTLEGEKVDLTNVAQNERLVVVLTGKVEDSKIDDPLITDWLIAGFELENPEITGIDPTTTLKWLGKQTKTEHLAYRNDRFAAAIDISNDDNNSFKIAYVVRAVSAGSFALPPAKIEDMYQPRYRAYSKFYTSRVEIKNPHSSVVQTQVKVDQNTTKINLPENVKKNVKYVLSEQDYLDVYDLAVKTLDKYTIVQLNFLRNSIFAHEGLSFERSNPMLHQRFLPYKWYKPTTDKSGVIFNQMSPLLQNNVLALLKEEKRRGGGLVLSDYYRVNNRILDKKSLAKYNKEELRILRNSLFARYGLDFKKVPELDRIYATMPWYKPNKKITVSQIFDEQMSEKEKANILLMIEVQKAL